MANELTENTNTTTQEQKPESTTDTASLEARIKQLESDNAKLRQANTNASADASKWKKQYQDKLSDEEKAKAERDEQDAALRTELETLRKEKNIASYKSILVANDIGIDAEIAGTVAEIGLHRLGADAFEKAFEKKDRLALGMTAPAHGLELTKVFYPERAFTEPAAMRWHE